MIELKPEDFKEWALNPATEFFVKEVIKIRQDFLEKIGRNFFEGQDKIQRTIGKCEALREMLDHIEGLKKVEAQDDK